MNSPFRFPAGFLWGAATSAYQIEGSPLADGAGANCWHEFSRVPGTIARGHTGDVACDHYARWEGDVALMQSLGLQSYRFSIAWSRILPEGTGRVNAKGVAFYDRLVDGLLAAGIAPNATLYHWDLPVALDVRGGWLNPDIADWFADYARVMFRALGDRVPMWATLNEPWVSVDGGYLHGVHAPGRRSHFDAVRAAHNIMRAHGAAVQVGRTETTQRIGVVVNIEPKYAATDAPADVAATRRAAAAMNEHYLDAMLLGRYPDALAEVYGDAWPVHDDASLALIRQPVDWVGINYYTRAVTCADPVAWPVGAGRVRQEQHAYTEMDWEVYPEGLSDTLVWFRDRYGDLPLYVTENGAAFYDAPVADGGRVDDPLRVAYYREHLRAVHRAIAAGVDVRGYYAWSLLDNFEWSLGYTRRFGLVHVDFATQQRTPKASAHWYAHVIATHGEALAP